MKKHGDTESRRELGIRKGSFWGTGMNNKLDNVTFLATLHLLYQCQEHLISWIKEVRRLQSENVVTQTFSLVEFQYWTEQVQTLILLLLKK